MLVLMFSMLVSFPAGPSLFHLARTTNNQYWQQLTLAHLSWTLLCGLHDVSCWPVLLCVSVWSYHKEVNTCISFCSPRNDRKFNVPCCSFCSILPFWRKWNHFSFASMCTGEDPLKPTCSTNNWEGCWLKSTKQHHAALGVGGWGEPAAPRSEACAAERQQSAWDAEVEAASACVGWCWMLWSNVEELRACNRR